MVNRYNPFKGKAHHHKGGFLSPHSPHQDGRHSGRMLQVLWELARRGNQSVSVPPGHVLSVEDARTQLQTLGDEDSVTWLGHACFLIRLGGVTFLTDPFLGERASPFQFSGPKRLVATPLQVEDLPQIDVILMSHNHYDHLDILTLRKIPNKAEVQVVTTLGLAPQFRRLGFAQIHELDWYEHVQVRQHQVVAVPAYHFSGRTLWDTNQTLWAGFGIHGPQGRVYFAGDTGYGPEFSRIGELTGPYDLALVPIGAYSPREVFAAVHASPEEGARIGDDVRARHSIGMHWGTIRLTTEPFMEPADRYMAFPTRSRKALMAIGQSQPFRDFLDIAEPLPLRRAKTAS